MAMSVKGAGQLRRLALAVQSMPRRVQKDAAEIAQRGIAALIDNQFDAKRDPYGVAWKPPKTGETMQKTGRLRRGFSVVIRPGSGQGLALEISNREEYAKWLQSGTEKMTARRAAVNHSPDSRRWVKRRCSSVSRSVLPGIVSSNVSLTALDVCNAVMRFSTLADVPIFMRPSSDETK